MKPIVAITAGDTNGVGYEVMIKALLTGYMFEIMRPVIYGNAAVAKQHIQTLDEEYRNITWNIVDSPEQAKDGRLNLLTCYPDNLPVQLGTNTAESNKAAKAALDRACADLKAGKVQALVTAPLNKEALHGGHTEYLEKYFGTMDNGQWTMDKNDPTKQTNPSSFSETVHRPVSNGESLMMLCSENLRVALVCNHVALADIPAQITEERILSKLTLLNKSLLRDFGMDKPRIAVLALNPHAGDAGLLGKEEQDIIVPAIEKAKEQGIWAFGPYAADGFFGSGHFTHFDAVLAMYHDQGLIPFKTLDMSGVNYTAGLSIVRTSPDHGTGYDIAGKNQADPSSMRNAIYMAIDVLRQREQYDAMTANPLPFIERADGEGKPRREFMDFKTTKYNDK
ncbi:MAG: 4-hydroxythreonine-4-phosphate dehydrogenase PdxA [Paludibacteraceae bacterium]|nr:4-hydroxythreonine-4-phosphate dehydrogenase PdxA [Paludibacteraceae bacterium]